MDKDRELRSLTARYSNWRRWMRDDAVHPIWPQIYNMLLSDLTFRTIVHAADLNPECGLHSPILARGLIAGYYTEQALFVRRLVDTTSATISLTNLLDDLDRSLSLMTRHNLVEVWDGTYDESTLSHYNFDRLAGVAEDKRSPEDRVRKRVIKTLRAWLETPEIKQLRQWSHTAIAHAAADASEKGKYSALAPNFRVIEAAQKQIVRTAEATWVTLLNGPMHGAIVPVLQYSQFRLFENVVGGMDVVRTAQEKWGELARDRDSWTDGVLEELFSTKAPIQAK